MGKYKVKKGDSWIKIANQNQVSLPDLLSWNGIDPTSKEALPALYPNQQIVINYPEPNEISSAYIVADAPKDYIDFGEKGKDLINKYTLAIQQGNMSFDQVPDVYKTAVYQKAITNKTNSAANNLFNLGLNTSLFLLDPIGYGLGFGAQKGTAYIADRASGRNDYGIGDLFKYTPIVGRESAQKRPGRAVAIDVSTGAFGGAVLRNLPNWIRFIAQNGRGMIQNALRTTGLTRQTMMYPGNQTFGTVYKEGTKGANKTGTVRAGRTGGYKPNTSAKGTFKNESSGNATMWINPDNSIPVIGTPGIPFVPTLPPVLVPPPANPPVKIPPEEPQHIYEQQAFSSWQGSNPGGVVVPYRPGTGIMSITGRAPIGNTVDQQALTNESVQVIPTYLPRSAVYQSGTIDGISSNIFSGLGILYGSENPGNLIIK